MKWTVAPVEVRWRSTWMWTSHMATNNRKIRSSTQPFDDVPELRSRLASTSDGTTECTIFPADLSPAERTTTWITAEEGSYLDVEAVR